MTEEISKDWKALLLSQVKSFKASTWLPFGVGVLLLVVIWMRDWSKPAKVESLPNPVRAAVTPTAATASGQMLLPDQLNLAFQQLVFDRAQQLKADVARNTQDKKHRCHRIDERICLEISMRRIAGQMSEALNDDGSLRVSPSRALALNVEAQALSTALAGLGVKDDEAQRLTQNYLPSGDSNSVMGFAASIQGLNEYLERRKVDRLSAAGKTPEDIPLKNGSSSLAR